MENRNLTLTLNAAEGVVQFVLAAREEEADVVLASQEWHAPSQGAELLAPALESALSLLGAKASHILRIACVTGPGSFTGLRLTTATATGLSLATGALTAGIPYLPLLAAGASDALLALGYEADIWAATHARNNLVHIQGFGHGLKPLTEILALSPAEAAAVIATAGAGGPAALLGSGLARNREAWRALLPGLPEKSVFLPPAFNTPSAAALARAAERLDYSAGGMSPLYVRPSDAEENLAAIAQKLGLDAKEAGDRLRGLTSSLDIFSG